MVDVNVSDLRKTIENLEWRLKNTKAELSHIESNCKHVWIESIEYITERIEYFSGKYNQAGVHIYPIMNYGDEQVKYYVRTCKCCGKIEKTKKTKSKVEEIADFI